MTELHTPTSGKNDAELAATTALLPEMPKTAGKPRIGRSWYARLSIAFGSALLMCAVGILALFAMLSRGPIDLPFLQERLAQALEQRMGGQIDVEVGRAVIQKATLGLELHVQDIVLKDNKGRTFIRAPDSIISFDNLRLMALDLAPRKLVLRNLAVLADISAQGEVRFMSSAGNELVQTATQNAARLEEAVGFVAAVLMDKGETGLQSLEIRDGSLRLDDKRSGLNTVFEHFNVRFDVNQRDENPGSGKSAALVSGEASRGLMVTPFEIRAVNHAEGFAVAARLRNLDTELFSILAGLRNPVVSTTARFAVELDAQVTTQGKLISASGRLSTGAGKLEVPGMAEVYLDFDRIVASGNWSAASNEVDAVRLQFDGQGHSINATGLLKLPTDGEAQTPMAGYRFTGQGKNWILAPLGKTDGQVVADAAIVLSAPANLQSFRIEQLDVSGPQTSIRLIGSMDEAGHVRIDLKAGKMPLRTVLRWWPSIFASQAHAYFDQNIVDGTSAGLNIAVDLSRQNLLDAMAQKPLPERAILLDIAFENSTLRIVDGIPPVTGLGGNARLTMLQAQGMATRGVMEMRAGRRISLSEGTFIIGKLDTLQPEATIRFRAQAALEAVIELLNQPAMKGATPLNTIPAEAKGQFDGRVAVALPLVKRLKSGDIVSEVSATVSGVTIDKAIGKDKLENATLAISTDKTGIDVKGSGTWQGLPVNIDMEQDSQDRSSSAVITLTLDEAALKRRGINLGRQLAGTLPVKIKTLQQDGGSLQAAVDVDLTRATIDGLLPGFQKAAGRPARLSFDVSEKPGGYTLQNIVLDSGVSSFRGQAEAMADGTVASARFTLFRLSAGDNVRLDFDRQNNGGKVVVRGNNFDARPFLRKMSEQGPQAQDGDKDLELDLKTTLLSGNGGEVLTNAELRLASRQGQIRQLSFTGRLNGKSVQISGRSPGDTPPVLAVQADDAGALLRFLDIYTRMVGGDVVGQVSPGPQRRMTGSMQFRNFTLRNEPAIRRLVAANARDGSSIQAGDAAFTKMRLDFNRTGSETTVREAVIFGPQIGLTFNGVVDALRDRVSLSGTFIPVFGLNNALAQIPVFGNLLAGGRNEGLLALTFGVSGRASAPNVTVNPLSAVAPGILRKIFEFRNETTVNSPPSATSAPN
jgi:hypothetical protein